MILNSDVESFGENFISQIRIADSEDTLKNISDENLVIIEKKCVNLAKLGLTNKAL